MDHIKSKSGHQSQDYLFDELVGAGTFGSVFKATHQTSGQVVAIKYIDLKDSNSS